MTIQALDTFTMWTAFLYGATLFFILELPLLKRVEERAPSLFLILRQHQPIALMCFWVGGLWIAQELLIKI